MESASCRTSQEKYEYKWYKRAISCTGNNNYEWNKKQCQIKYESEPQVDPFPCDKRIKAKYNKWIEPYYIKVHFHLKMVRKEIEEYHQQR